MSTTVKSIRTMQLGFAAAFAVMLAVATVACLSVVARNEGTPWTLAVVMLEGITSALIVGLTGWMTLRDLSERRREESALLAREERTRLLIEGVQDYAIFLLDPQGMVVSWNAGAERIKGYKASEIIGQHFSRFYTSEDLATGKPSRELVEAVAQGKYEEEGSRVRKDGSRFWANVIIIPLLDEKGELRGFSKITRDITARKTAEALL